MSEPHSASCGEADRLRPGRDGFEGRILTMLEGAAFALLQDQIKAREDAAYAAALNKLQRERDEVAKLQADVEAAHKAAEQQLQEVQGYKARIRRRVRRAVQAANVYRKAVEEIRERLDELISAADAYGISNELEALVALIEKATTMDPDFQAGP